MSGQSVKLYTLRCLDNLHIMNLKTSHQYCFSSDLLFIRNDNKILNSRWSLNLNSVVNIFSCSLARWILLKMNSKIYVGDTLTKMSTDVMACSPQRYLMSVDINFVFGTTAKNETTHRQFQCFVIYGLSRYRWILSCPAKLSFNMHIDMCIGNSKTHL